MMSGNKAYTISYLETVVKEDIPALPKRVASKLKVAIESRLTLDPIGFGKPLRYSLKGHRRLRVGDYRIVYRIKPDKNLVLIITIKHRKAVYQ